MADQNERAFQKQPTINLNRKGGLKPSESRWAVSTLFIEVRFEYWEYSIQYWAEYSIPKIDLVYGGLKFNQVFNKSSLSQKGEFRVA